MPRVVRPLLTLLLTAATASALAEPLEIPIPQIKTALAPQPDVHGLPSHADLPDALLKPDGTKVTTAAQWQERRKEIRQILEYYSVGAMPPPPGNLQSNVLSAQTVLDGTAHYRLVHLTFGPDRKLSLDIGIFTPATGGPFPAIIFPGGTPPGATPLLRLPPGPTGPETAPPSKARTLDFGALARSGRRGWQGPPASLPPP